MIKPQIVKPKINSNDKNNSGSMDKLIFEEKNNGKNDKEIDLDMFQTTDLRSRKGLRNFFYFCKLLEFLKFF